MIQTTNNSLVISIKDTAPKERREWLIKAIAAAIRWNGNVSQSDKYTTDGDNLVVLAQLLEELVN